MTLNIPFDNSYARLPRAFFTSINPEPASASSLIAYNDSLAEELGVFVTETSAIAAQLSGQDLPDGAAPLAQVYAGHQFGSYNPQLGDGRAVLLGELIDTNGVRRDIQLKGSGRTPYSRMGDGKAWLGPVLREYIVSEAMHALGIPTTRALAAVRTGDKVVRESVLPGAVLTRVAQSHLRVGSFEFFARTGQISELKLLTEYAIERHYPRADGPISLLENVVAAQARLIPAWMSVGFIHGVMNTDNCTISGETIDYGPCAFMDVYDPQKVFSSIDQMGRYAFDNQPRIVVWNMAQLATALIQQCDDKDVAVKNATQIVHAMPAQLKQEWLAHFGRKIGLSDAQPQDTALIQDLLDLMAAHQADFTNTFRALGTGKAREQFSDPQAFDAWDIRWSARVRSEKNVDETLALTNPTRIPRNHQIESMINASLNGNDAPFHRLLKSGETPYLALTAYSDLESAPTTEEIVDATFCGT